MPPYSRVRLLLSFELVCHPTVSKIPEELLKPSYLLLEPVRYTLAEILRLCRRPMVLPGPLVRSMLQDLLGAVALCHDRNVVIKSLDAEKVGVIRTTIVVVIHILANFGCSTSMRVAMHITRFLNFTTVLSSIQPLDS